MEEKKASVDEAINGLQLLENALRGAKVTREALEHVRNAEKLAQAAKQETDKHLQTKAAIEKDIAQLESQKKQAVADLQQQQQTYRDALASYVAEVDKKKIAATKQAADAVVVANQSIAAAQQEQKQAEQLSAEAKAAHTALLGQLNAEINAMKEKLRQAKAEYSTFVAGLR
jgi:hypothetical protein